MEQNIYISRCFALASLLLHQNRRNLYCRPLIVRIVVFSYFVLCSIISLICSYCRQNCPVYPLQVIQAIITFPNADGLKTAFKCVFRSRIYISVVASCLLLRYTTAALYRSFQRLFHFFKVAPVVVKDIKYFGCRVVHTVKTMHL